jgi:hypothetical protein
MRLANEAPSKNTDALVGRLAKIGAPAVHPILAAMSGPYPREQHPTDVVEALGAALDEIARRNPEPLIEILEVDSVPPDPQMFYLTSALKHTKSKAVFNPPTND